MRLMWCVAFVLLLLSNAPAFADCSANACGTVHVERLYVNAEGLIYVATSGTETSLSCTPVSGKYLTLVTTATNADEVFSTLLAAQLADKQVTIRIVTSSSNCSIAYITLDRQ